MTILYFADTRFPIERANGVQTMATCHALAQAGHDVHLIVRPDTAPTPRDPVVFYGLAPVAGLHVTPLATSGSGWLRRVTFLARAWRVARRHRNAVVFTRDLGFAALLVQLPRARRPRLIYESHGIAPIVAAEMPALLGNPSLSPSPAKLQRLDRRERMVWQRAGAYVTITRALADDLIARYGSRDDVFVVPDGAAALQPTATDPYEPHGVPIAAYAGHLYPWKGVDVFVRALAQAPRVRGLIVGGHPGESDRARVEALAREVGVEDRLEITGLVEPAKVAGHLARASILVLPNIASSISERYTSPLKLFEYLWCGRAIVASDLPAIREVLTTDETALLVAAGDPSALALALERLVAAPELARRLGAAARQLAPAFTWTRRAQRLEPALAAAIRS